LGVRAGVGVGVRVRIRVRVRVRVRVRSTGGWIRATEKTGSRCKHGPQQGVRVS
jgi:hypothetical protein